MKKHKPKPQTGEQPGIHQPIGKNPDPSQVYTGQVGTSHTLGPGAQYPPVEYQDYVEPSQIAQNPKGKIPGPPQKIPGKVGTFPTMKPGTYYPPPPNALTNEEKQMM